MKRFLAALLIALAVASSAFAGSSNPPPSNPTPGYFKLDPSLLPHWRAAVARVRAGTGRGRLAVVGDSIPAGGGAGTTGVLGIQLNAARPKAWVSALATLLNSTVTASDNEFFTDHSVAAPPTNYPTYDTRVTFGTGWGVTSAQASVGGSLIHYTSGSASTLSFAPGAAVQFDTLIIWYAKTGASGSFTVNVDGGSSLGTINANGANAFTSATFSVTRGVHTINLVAGNDNTDLFIAGVLVQDSTTPAIDIFNLGSVGAKTASFVVNTQPWSALNALGTLAPDLTIIALTINDSNNATPLAAYSSQLQTIITEAKLSGDVILAVGPPSGTTQGTDGTLDQYIAVMRGLAAANAAPMIDMKYIWTSEAATVAAGMPYLGDTIHPMALGHQDIAQRTLKVLTQP